MSLCENLRQQRPTNRGTPLTLTTVPKCSSRTCRAHLAWCDLLEAEADDCVTLGMTPGERTRHQERG